MNSTYDTLFINDLTIPCIIGAHEHERKDKQLVIINIELSIDTKTAGKTDDLQDTVNYQKIAHDVASMVERSDFYLLEKLAQSAADICLQDKRVKQVKIRIEKPKAVKLAKSSAIEITRNNKSN